MQVGLPDLVILGMIFLSILIGLVRGFVRESISMVTWVSAVVLAVVFTSTLGEYMTFTKIPLVRMIAAFTIIFVGTIFIGAIVNFSIGSLVSKTPFTIPDRILGSFFGLLRGIVFVTILVLLGGLTSFPEAEWWQGSYTMGRFQNMAVWLKDQLPEDYAKGFNFPTKDNLLEKEKVISQK